MYGIDISEEMLKKAKEKVLDTVTLSLGDTEHLPLKMVNLIVCYAQTAFIIILLLKERLQNFAEC